MDYLTFHCILWVLKILETYEANKCVIGKAENKQLPCCTNYFWDKGECKECPPGYFGMNCSTRCSFPNYGQHCQKECNCNVIDCNHVDGCQGKDSHAETSTNWSTKYTFSKNVYKHTSTINEDLTPFLSVVTSLKTSLTVDKTNEQSNDDKETNNESFSLIIILLLGCVLVILLAFKGVTWISKPTRRYCTNSMNARDNDTIETDYMEITGGSNQQEPVSITMRTTVLARSCPSLDGVETRPELPARNTCKRNQNPAHANKNNATYGNV